MLRITIPEQELWDEKENRFINTKKTNICLEHSLVSISKWEAIYNKPFINNANKDDKTNEEIMKYIECMTITQNVDPNIYHYMPSEVIKQITDYISSPQSATKFVEKEGQAPSREILTSEKIYFYMTAFNIPFECEKWPIQRLMNLIRICSDKNAPSKKMSPKEAMSRQSALNKARRAQSNSRG